MVASTRTFLIELYQEYLEEASFLYEQRLSLFDDPEITWIDIEDFEERFEAHIDGLVVGEELALDVCKTQASEGDFGELHAAVRVFCRQNRKDLVLGILDALDPDDAERMQAVSDALKEELPEVWQDQMIQILTQKDQKFFPILIQLLAHRRLHLEVDLLQLLHQNGSNALPVLIRTLGHLRRQNMDLPFLNDCLQHGDESVRSAAALSLLQLGDAKTIKQCLRSVHAEHWPLLPLGLSGNRTAVPVILEVLSSGRVNADGLVALGLLGDIAAIKILLAHLANEDFGESPAIALNLITGAELYEEVFIPEEIEEDELFEEELEKFKQGEVPTRLGGEPFGSDLTRLSQNPEAWQKWWDNNRTRFDPKIRYRNGKPYTPACLLENLQHEKSVRKVRQFAYEEWVIRYGVDFPFETDMPVHQQKKTLRRYEEWIQANGKNFQPGKWYFSGKIFAP